MELLLIIVGAIAFAGVVLLAARRRPLAASPLEATDAVRRDVARLIDELQTAVRQQVDRLDREVRRVQETIAEAERVRAALETARTLPAPKSTAPPPPPPANPLHARVFELRDSGKDPADIGVETGLEVGEVELILGLRRMPPRA